MTNERKTGGNSTYKKLAVQWLNEALCFVSTFVVKIATFAKPETVIGHAMATVQPLTDNTKMNSRTVTAK